MAKVEVWNDNCVYFLCPGCGNGHRLPFKVNPAENGGKHPVWTFNGDVNAPTLSPSILSRWTFSDTHEPRVCHSFVRNGRIEFLSDCTHAMAGKTVELPDIEEDQEAAPEVAAIGNSVCPELAEAIVRANCVEGQA